MPSTSRRLTAEDFEELKSQTYEMIRTIYEDKIGGADLGDVFSIVGDVFTLALDPDASGLQKTGKVLSIKIPSDGGLVISGYGIEIKIHPTGGLECTAAGIKIKLDGTSLQMSASGLKVGQSAFIADPSGGAPQDAESRAAINSILDLLIARGLIAAS